ncbi:MAG: OsmC family protein [Bacteroidetes bacterium]|jgi:putative redox protein|nr:OsmC family protein [Bacteroidota bacterium]
MKINITRVDNDFHMECRGSSEVKVHIDAAEKIGGHNAGARPMELILMGLGSCSAIDLIAILKKQRQNPDDLSIDLHAKRAENKIPAVFTDIHITFKLKGRLDEIKVQRAIELSVEKYCSVYEMLKDKVNITYSYSIN